MCKHPSLPLPPSTGLAAPVSIAYATGIQVFNGVVYTFGGYMLDQNGPITHTKSYWAGKIRTNLNANGSYALKTGIFVK